MTIDWKTLPSLSSLRAFELTAQSGNFAAAARALNVTHAAIAQRVRALEADLGVALVRRSGRSITLTEPGRRLASHLSDGFGTIAAGIAQLKAEQSAKPVQIATTYFFSQEVLLPMLHEFWRLHPDIQVSVLPSNEIVDITALGLDLAIRATGEEPNWPGLKAERLVESDAVIVGAPSLIHDEMMPIDQLPWIWSEGAWHEESAVRAFGLDLDTLKNVDIGVPYLQVSLARQGLGLTTSPEILVRADLEADTLRKAPVPSPFSVTYYAVTPRGPVRPETAKLVDWLKAALASDSKPPDASG